MNIRLAAWAATGKWPDNNDVVEMTPIQYELFTKLLNENQGRYDFVSDGTEVHDPTGTWTPQQHATQTHAINDEYENR